MAGRSAAEIKELLQHKECLTFPQFESGLFPAMIPEDDIIDKAGYTNSWLRDTVCIAYVLWRAGHKERAHRAVHGLLKAMERTEQIMIDTVRRGKGGDDYQRPAIRFTADGHPISKWANGQNDALGYVMWLVGLLYREDGLWLAPHEQLLLDLLPSYFNTIEYWRDKDSGHWEEEIKCNTSSIGAVVAGLRAARPVLSDKELCDQLIQKGERALKAILPYESKTPGDERRTDAALLFLIEPLGVLASDSADKIVDDITTQLQGDIGIKRYLGDSYWSPDFREHFAYKKRSADFSKHMARRDRYFKKDLEAQWTLFDPLLAAHYAKRGDADKANWYLARSLAQVIQVGRKKVWRLPEAFFLEKGEWVPNDQIGLLWSQANLLYALNIFRDVYGDQPVAGQRT